MKGRVGGKDIVYAAGGDFGGPFSPCRESGGGGGREVEGLKLAYCDPFLMLSVNFVGTVVSTVSGAQCCIEVPCND
jgi:hypothetical protein